MKKLLPAILFALALISVAQAQTVKMNPNTLYQKGAAQTTVPTQSQMDAVATQAAGALQATSYSGTITVSGPFSGRPVIHRTATTGGAFGLGSGQVPITLTLTVPVAYLEYETVDATTGAVEDPWQPYNGSTRPGSQTITPTASVRQGWDYFEFRANGDNTSVVTTNVPFGVGIVVAGLGQSLMCDMFSPYCDADGTTLASLGIVPSPFTSMFAVYAQEGSPDVNNPPTWATPADGTVYNSASGVIMMNYLAGQCSCDVGFVGYGVGSSSQADWLPNITANPNYPYAPFPHFAEFLSILKNGVTGLDAVIWRQGHADAKIFTPQSVYVTNLITIRNAIRAIYPGVAFVYSTIPGLGTYAPATLQSVMAIKAAGKQVAAADIASQYVDGLNAQPLIGGVHPSQAGGIPDGNNYGRAISALLGFQPNGMQGPTISGPVYMPAGQPTTIYIPIQQNGGTALVGTGTPSSQFEVCLQTDTSCASPLSLSGITLNPSNVLLGLSSFPGTSVPLNVYYRPYPDSTTAQTSGIFDNYTNGDGVSNGRQLIDPAAPMPMTTLANAMSVVTPGAANSGASIPLSGNYYGETPPSLDYATDDATWTAASSPTISGGTYSFSLASGLSAGIWQIWIRDHTDFGNFTNTNPFSISLAGPTFPTIPNHYQNLNLPNTTLGFLFSDTGCTQQASISQSIGCVRDFGGTGNNFHSYSNPSQLLTPPVYQANLIGGRPGLNFTAANSDIMQNYGGGGLPTLLQNSTGWTIYDAFVPKTLPSSGNYTIYNIGAGAAPRITISIGTTGLVTCAFQGDTGSASVTSTTGISASAVADTVCGWDGTNLHLVVNNQADVTAPTTGFTQTTAWTAAWLGAARTGSLAWGNFSDIDELKHDIFITPFLSSYAASLYTYTQAEW